ncbi:hypothetical protein [Mesorhizobium marinum]|uniref:Uncharacterized protein n=1 Tax=Mesorhizobium marinum TaxID=3228790 RepID=A0ABV3R1W2_9HYPH
MTDHKQTLDASMPTIPSDKSDVAPAMTPERAAHLRNLNQVKKNFVEMLACKFSPGTKPRY